MRRGALKVFKKGKAAKTIPYNEMAKTRMDLLNERKELRLQMGAGIELWKTTEKLKAISKRCNKMRRKYRNDVKEMHEEDLRLATNLGDEHAAWKVIYRLSGKAN